MNQTQARNAEIENLLLLLCTAYLSAQKIMELTCRPPKSNQNLGNMSLNMFPSFNYTTRMKGNHWMFENVTSTN
jgi:hypothetical protein